MNLINNPQSSQCPQIGDTYHLADVCPNINIDTIFNLVDELITASNQLPRFLQGNSREALSHLIHTFVVPMYIDMEVFFNLPEGTIFNKEDVMDAPFNATIDRNKRQITIEDIANTFARPDEGVNLRELLSSANIDGRLN